MSSAKAVAAVRAITHAAKAGHGGTLDPIATGVLPIAMGEATKTVAFALDADKSYRFTVRWGEARDTDDSEGQVIAQSDQRPERAAIEALLPAFTGRFEQRPPAFSALKVDGERAYALARAGAPPELQPRPVTVHRFELKQADPDSAVFEVDCAKGTYVRALARDLGERLGCYGYVEALRRTRVGRFGEAEAISLERLRAVWHRGQPCEHLYPVVTVLDDIPALALTGPQAERLSGGQGIRVLDTDDGLFRAMAQGRLIALAEVQGGDVRPVRVFNLR
jgi:tRNA pseudouridine55 synthase